ncbi:hypothetical protein ABB29_08730 [Pseudoxanthomonas dokdonensis]|uniref:Uncharacterized protein n=1 Tax=Pseudoxanthomonas dokdonensis TaxID=344882 RepID=A0A0R0CV82_9GAMM|nr:hypothetical protein ABB29_08730 [Pseudoxanthomonas dokdonensis]
MGIVAVTADHTPCDDAADARGKPAPAVAIPRNRTPGLAGASAKAAAKSSLPTASGVSHGGGGDDVDATLQRPRSPKWHSFLPGMFR